MKLEYLQALSRLSSGVGRVADGSATRQRHHDSAVRDEHDDDGQQVDQHVEERRVCDSQTPLCDVLHAHLATTVNRWQPNSHDERKGKPSPYSITERRVPELIPVLGSQHAGDVSHKPGGRLPILSARPAVTPATLKRAVTNFAA